MDEEGQEFRVARGGIGGYGNYERKNIRLPNRGEEG